MGASTDLFPGVLQKLGAGDCTNIESKLVNVFSSPFIINFHCSVGKTSIATKAQIRIKKELFAKPWWVWYPLKLYEIFHINCENIELIWNFALGFLKISCSPWRIKELWVDYHKILFPVSSFPSLSFSPDMSSGSEISQEPKNGLIADKHDYEYFSPAVLSQIYAGSQV